MQCLEVAAHGSPDVLRVTERPVPELAAGELRLEVAAAGVNFAEVMARRGTYPGGPEPPYVPGFEVAGRVDAVGATAAGFEPGDRVVSFVAGGAGGYAEYATVRVAHAFRVPPDLPLASAVVAPIQWTTAHNCLFAWGGLEAGERVLVHAAAGGVGTAAVQLAREAGATVFGTAITPAKRERAEAMGCERALPYEDPSFVEALAEATGSAADSGERQSASVEA